ARKKLGPARSPSEMSIGEYVNALRPRNNTETALAIAGYLFKEQNQREFTTQDIEDGFHDILRPLPGNTSQAIANSVKQGFIMKRDKVEGVYHYSVTQSGLERLQEGFGNNK
ncbi:MAG: hypothetical protein ACE5IJ_11455, partial [Thermoplasmata archaeon]